MIVTTTPTIEGKRIVEYRGLVTGEVIMGANVVRDIFAAFSDVFGGRAGAYEAKLGDGRETALREMKERAADRRANAVVGVDLDYEVIGRGMLMVSATGTAVIVQ